VEDQVAQVAKETVTITKTSTATMVVVEGAATAAIGQLLVGYGQSGDVLADKHQPPALACRVRLSTTFGTH
jgi:hypothetical protein